MSELYYNLSGAELALMLAVEYRQHQIDLLNLMGAGYTDSHGKRQLIPNNVKEG